MLGGVKGASLRSRRGRWDSDRSYGTGLIGSSGAGWAGERDDRRAIMAVASDGALSALATLEASSITVTPPFVAVVERRDDQVRVRVRSGP